MSSDSICGRCYGGKYVMLLLLWLGTLISVVTAWTAPFTIKIANPLPSDPALNLAEVQALNNGVLVNPTGCGLSGTYTQATSAGFCCEASYCCNGILTDMCHSYFDVNAYFTVSVPSVFNSVKVYNRPDASPVGSARLVGANITIYDSTNAVIWKSTFNSSQFTYTFFGWTLTAAPTAAPTVQPSCPAGSYFSGGTCHINPTGKILLPRVSFKIALIRVSHCRVLHLSYLHDSDYDLCFIGFRRGRDLSVDKRYENLIG
jgi:hypothetical protein